MINTNNNNKFTKAWTTSSFLLTSVQNYDALQKSLHGLCSVLSAHVVRDQPLVFGEFGLEEHQQGLSFFEVFLLEGFQNSILRQAEKNMECVN